MPDDFTDLQKQVREDQIEIVRLQKNADTNGELITAKMSLVTELRERIAALEFEAAAREADMLELESRRKRMQIDWEFNNEELRP